MINLAKRNEVLAGWEKHADVVCLMLGPACPHLAEDGWVFAPSSRQLNIKCDKGGGGGVVGGGGQYRGPWWKQSQPLNHLSSLHSITLSHCLLACYCFCFIYTSNVLCTKTSFQVVWEAFFPTNFTYNAFNDFEGKWVLGLGLAVFWLFLNERLICAKFVVLT